jgi:hypothetical protein
MAKSPPPPPMPLDAENTPDRSPPCTPRHADVQLLGVPQQRLAVAPSMLQWGDDDALLASRCIRQLRRTSAAL